MSETQTATTPVKPRKGPRPSAETIRKRVSMMIGSGNVERLDREGYAVVPKEMIAELHAMMVTAPNPEVVGEG